MPRRLRMCSKPPWTVRVADVSTTVGMFSKTSSCSISDTSMGVACRKVCRVCDRIPADAAGGLVGVRAADDAALEPVDHVAGIGFEQELELGAEAGYALSQTGGFVDVGKQFHL